MLQSSRPTPRWHLIIATCRWAMCLRDPYTRTDTHGSESIQDANPDPTIQICQFTVLFKILTRGNLLYFIFHRSANAVKSRSWFSRIWPGSLVGSDWPGDNLIWANRAQMGLRTPLGVGQGPGLIWPDTLDVNNPRTRSPGSRPGADWQDPLASPLTQLQTPAMRR